MRALTPCFAIRIKTPKRYLLDGLWFGPARAKRVIVFVHGLGGSAFEKHALIFPWVSRDTAVLAFSNRGHDDVATVRRKTKMKKEYRSLPSGTAHEAFADCIDDIQGAVNFAKHPLPARGAQAGGAKEIYLAGHSTGCQKIVFYSAKKPDRNVRGLILLAPVSDYAAAKKSDRGGKLARTTALARAMVRNGEGSALLPKNAWREMLDAKRFLSLYTPESVEEIFSYAQPKKRPAALRRVRFPVLALLAEKDEYADRPAKALAWWFEKTLPKNDATRVRVIPNVRHGFRGGERQVASFVRGWLPSARRSR